MKTLKMSFLSLLCLGILFTSCNNNGAKDDQKVTEILGAGATFPYPLYSKMFSEYNKQTGIQVNYQSIGSGGGIKQLQAKTVDFGASDAPMNEEEISKSPSPVVHIPTCLGAVIVTYNLPGNPVLEFTPDVIADIFLGKIKKWNDPRIKSLNTGANLPDMSISVVHRSDGSGTTYVFSDYLSKVSADWNTKPGKGKSLDWPVGIGSKGNEGVGGTIKQTPGSIGYLELAYVMQNKMPSAKIKNKAGNFVEATLASISAAANIELPADLRVSLTDTDAPDGYPISSFTYILIYTNQSYDNRSEEKAKAVYTLVNWMIHDGQKFAEPLNYAPLPAAKLKAVEDMLKTVSFNNKPLM